MKSADDTPPALRLRDFLPYRLSVVAEEVSHLFAARYEARFGLTIPEWRVVAVLGEEGAVPTGLVIARTAMDRVRVSRAVIRLADKGVLAREADPRDGRAQILRLTEAGQATYRAIVPLARALEAGLAAALSAEERRQLEAILDRLGEAARRMGADSEGEAG